MEFAMWAYPWDFMDRGPETAESRLRDIGITEVNLATNYHTVQAFTPHNPERRTVFAKASSYFTPGAEYDRLRPVPFERMDGDWVNAIANQLSELSLTAWTVGCHNSRLGMKNRECTLESAHGDDLVFGLCPSNPAVQTYLTSLVSDLTSRDGIDRIELETFDYFYGTGFGWHHQKIHVRLGMLGEFLFGLCFCPHCRTAATSSGVDVQRARSVVARTIDEIITGDVAHDRRPEEWLREHGRVAAYTDVREETLFSLFAELSTAADSTPLGYYVGAPAPGREWMVGADLEALSTHVDYYCLPAYESSAEEVIDAYRAVDDVVGGHPLHVGLLPAHPAVYDEESVVNMLVELESRDVPRVSFYNYGLLPPDSLERIGTAIDVVS